MKIGRVIQKIAPIAASALMLGSTVGFAAAADLSEYPGPFVTATKVDVAIVLGADAESVDVIGSNDIIGSLVVPIASGGEVTTVAGGEVKDIPVSRNLNDNTYGWSSALTDSDVPSLLDSEVSIDIGSVSDDYSVHEEIVFAAGSRLATGVNVTTPGDDFKDKVFIELPQKSITYRYVFDEAVKGGNYLANASNNEPVTLNILGNELEITAATGTTFTAKIGKEIALKVGESSTVAVAGVTKTVKLINVGSGGAIIVEVDGVQDTISSGSTKRINEVRVKNDETFYSTTFSERQATLIVGEDTTKTYKTGDEFIGQDEDDPNWVWQLNNLNGADDSGKPKINVTWDQTWTDDDEVLYVGDTLNLPNNHVSIALSGLTEDKWQEYEVERERTELYNSTGGNDGGGEEWNKTTQNTLVIKGPSGVNDAFKMPSTQTASACSGKETNRIYIYGYKTKQPYTNFTVFWWDDANPGKSPKFCFSTDSITPIAVTIQYDDASYNLDILNVTAVDDTNVDSQLRLTIGRAEQQYVNVTSNTSASGFDDGVGTDLGKAVASDVRICPAAGTVCTTGVGTAFEEDTLTVDGLRVYDPKANIEGNKFKFAIANDENTDFRVNVAVTGTGGGTSTGGGGTQFTKPPVGVSVLDTEVNSVRDKNLIVVGGSAVNRVAAQLLGLSYPTYGGDPAWQSATGVTGQGQAIVKLFDSPYATGKVAMLVAGWSGEDSRRASKALATGTPALSGNEALLVTATEQVTVKA